MATGIVSVAMYADGRVTLSRALLTLTAIGWGVLGVVCLHRALVDRPRWREEARQPSSLAAVAGTAVLGVRLTVLGWSWAGCTLLAIATGLCLILLGDVWKARVLPLTGAAFLVVVAPQSLAVLAAALAQRLVLGWLGFGGLLLFAFALGGYVVVLARFEFAQLRLGAGDHWVSAGALAISTLACVETARAAGMVRALSALHDPLRVSSVVLSLLTIAWLPALIGAEALWTRPRYDVRRWATVFPLGMYSIMGITVGAVTGLTWMRDFGRIWAWVALAAWIATAIGAARAIRGLGSRPVPSSAPRLAGQQPAERPSADRSLRRSDRQRRSGRRGSET